jgi:hypothetical protein
MQHTSSYAVGSLGCPSLFPLSVPCDATGGPGEPANVYRARPASVAFFTSISLPLVTS